MDLGKFAMAIIANPSLHTVSLDRLLFFLASIPHLKDDILLMQTSVHTIASPPATLPASMQSFFSTVCDLPVSIIQELWFTFKDVAWHDPTVSDNLSAPLATFHAHGLPHGYTGRTLYPPDQFCSISSCPRMLKGLWMMHAEQWQCVLYTVSDGPLPVYSVHLYCEACEVNYHHNFKVYKGERTYYQGVPAIIQVGEHQFVERQVIDMWLALMDNCTSATACASFYNTAMSQSNEPLPDWSFGFTLSSDHVWSAFLLLCLLEDAVECEEHLVVKHTGDQKDHFSNLIQACNQRMRIKGQPELTHFCNKCTRWYPNGDGKFNRKCSVVVTDGVCIGHPCCSQHNCQVPLHSVKDRFCPIHASLESICSIVGCESQVVEGHLTCNNIEHQKIKQLHQDKGQSRFQLRERLQCAHAVHSTNHTSNSQALSELTSDDNDNEEFTVHPNGRVSADGLDDESPDQDKPPANTARKVRAKFTCSRTHNEQLAVAPCGMILGRDMMFGAEGIASVAIMCPYLYFTACANRPPLQEFIKRTFRIKALKPDHVFFDNNCLLAQHVKSDPYFADMGLTVDMFHFKSKHKETDTFCQEHCNPAAYPELISQDGQGWFFNSSVAEQVNVWIGGYHAICREMFVDKYDFFLDQMILRRNRATKAKLAAQGCRPGNWPV